MIFADAHADRDRLTQQSEDFRNELFVRHRHAFAVAPELELARGNEYRLSASVSGLLFIASMINPIVMLHESMALPPFCATAAVNCPRIPSARTTALIAVVAFLAR